MKLRTATAKRAGVFSALFIAGCTSTATLPPDHPSKTWKVSARGETLSVASDEKANRPFWSPGKPVLSYDNAFSVSTQETEIAKLAHSPPSETPKAATHPALIPQLPNERSPTGPVIPRGQSLDLQILSGRVTVIDGDTLELATETVKLLGVDAPELAQDCTVALVSYPCGMKAKLWLIEKTNGKDLRCEGTARDEGNRLIAVCWDGSSNLNAEIIRAGWALAKGKDGEKFGRFQNAAKRAKAGVWQGGFILPWEWRQTPETRLTSPTGVSIKKSAPHPPPPAPAHRP